MYCDTYRIDKRSGFPVNHTSFRKFRHNFGIMCRMSLNFTGFTFLVLLIASGVHAFCTSLSYSSYCSGRVFLWWIGPSNSVGISNVIYVSQVDSLFRSGVDQGGLGPRYDVTGTQTYNVQTHIATERNRGVRPQQHTHTSNNDEIWWRHLPTLKQTTYRWRQPMRCDASSISLSTHPINDATCADLFSI